MMLDRVFSALGLHSVMLSVGEFSIAGIRAYEKVGSGECGQRRQSHWMGRRLWDEIYMECLAPSSTVQCSVVSSCLMRSGSQCTPTIVEGDLLA